MPLSTVGTRATIAGTNCTAAPFTVTATDARTQPWGNSSGVITAAGTGSGLAQSLTVYGRVPAQTTPSPGAYTDTVVVTLTY